jgi:hypothetical protein
MWSAPRLLRQNVLHRVKLCPRNKTTTELTIGDVTIRRTVDSKTPMRAGTATGGAGPAGEMESSIPSFFEFDTMPKEVVMHLRWMAQKYSMGQDMFLCGHPGPLRRRLALTFANAAGLEVEYVPISRDTTENDLKQRREIRGNSVVFHDQAPVRAAVHGRLLVLDGIEYAERNVLPTLNNLLENREMSLEDGRFLTTHKTISAIKGSSSNILVPVHPDFRVIALGQCVPPYNGRTMDPPLRSRFQSRFVDELTTESILELFAKESSLIDSAKLQAVADFYESLRLIRTNALHESSSVSLTGLPVYSTDSVQHTLSILKEFPNMSVGEAISRSVPAASWLLEAVPSKFKHSVSSSMEKLQLVGSHETYSVASMAASTSKGSGKSTTLSFSSRRADLESSSLIDSVKSKIGLTTNVEGTVAVDCNSGLSGDSHLHIDFASLMGSLMDSQRNVLSDMLMDHSLDRHVCILGPRVSNLHPTLRRHY